MRNRQTLWFLVQLILIFGIVQISHARENLTIQMVDMNLNRRELSIVSQQSGDHLIFKPVIGFQESSIAQVVYLQQINQTGWSFMHVRTFSKFNDELQAYFAGVSEAMISHEVLDAHWENTFKDYCSSDKAYCSKLELFLRQNMESMIIKSRRNGGYWKMVRLMLWQIKGMQDGYDKKWMKNSSQINDDYLMTLKSQVLGLYLLQAQGDLSALSDILNQKKEVQQRYHVIGSGSCSAFIKYLAGDLYMAHDTWNTYDGMLRVTKQYDFPYRLHYDKKRNLFIPSMSISFSSYPGVITSIDDFYVTSGGLVTIETTNGNYNQSRWKGLNKKAKKVVFEFFRVMVANRLAQNGPDWIKYFSKFNSGTYNNQWMIVNNNLMTDHRFGNPIPNEVLYVAEQIPGLVVSEDVTATLRSSFWASYNIPYNKRIYEESGFVEMAKKYGNFFTHDKGPRAMIFKRDGPKVNDSISFMRLMRYNNYKHDPLARCDCKPPYSAENGISARCDLNPTNGTYPFGALGFRMHGGTDMKLTTTTMAKDNIFIGISGPTYDQQPPFDWSNHPNSKMKHRMQPQKFTFSPYVVPPLRHD